MLKPFVACHSSGFYLFPSADSHGGSAYVDVRRNAIDLTLAMEAFALNVSPLETNTRPLRREDGRYVAVVGRNEFDLTVFVQPILEGLRTHKEGYVRGSGISVPLQAGRYRLSFAGVSAGRFAAWLDEFPEPRMRNSSHYETAPASSAPLAVGSVSQLGQSVSAEAVSALAKRPSLEMMVGQLSAAGADYFVVGHGDSGLAGTAPNSARAAVRAMLGEPTTEINAQYVHVVVPSVLNPALFQALSALKAVCISSEGQPSFTDPEVRLQVGEHEYSTSWGALRVTAVDVARWAAMASVSEQRLVAGLPIASVTPAAHEGISTTGPASLAG